ncbi:ComEC/Rec2 family competence protein [Segnochrobactraceae bacterium EtOH-i3]
MAGGRDQAEADDVTAGAGAAVLRWLGRCLETDLRRGRGLPLVALAFVAGAGLYALLPAEPMLLATGGCAAGAALGAALSRTAPLRRGALLLIAALLAGLFAGGVQTIRVAAPRLERARSVEGTGRVLSIEERAGGSTRIEIAPVRLDRIPPGGTPERIRLTTRSRAPLPRPGAGIAFRARLEPPRGPIVPGGYDGARAAYFAGLGATGFLLGAPRVVEIGPPTFGQRLALLLTDLRAAIGARIRAAIPGPSGTVAAALLVGERGPIPDSVDEALRTAGLAHILSISGVHMTLVAGTVFGAVRLGFALIPAIALRRPVKKWAAVAGLLAATAYLALSGAEVATQRSYIMIALVFLAILAGRSALTLRTIALAALVVTALDPASVTGPGYQMSFAAVLALIAAFDTWSRYREARPRPPVNGRVANLVAKGGGWVAGVAVTSLVAGLATAPAAAFHFGRVAPFGLFGNLLAMPIVGVIVMPAGVAALFLMPLGLEGPPLWLMGEGITAVLAIADWLHGLFGAADLGRRIPLAAALWLSGGLVWLALWSTAWRLLGLAPVVIGLTLAVLDRPADILVSDDGAAVLMRGAAGSPRLWRGEGGSFAARVMLEAMGDRRAPGDRSLRAGRACDAIGCVLSGGPEGAKVSVLTDPLGFLDDCSRATLIVSASLGAPADCAAFVVDPAVLARTGSLALVLDPAAPKGVRILARGLPAQRRPWHPPLGEP